MNVIDKKNKITDSLPIISPLHYNFQLVLRIYPTDKVSFFIINLRININISESVCRVFFTSPAFCRACKLVLFNQYTLTNTDCLIICLKFIKVNT